MPLPQIEPWVATKLHAGCAIPAHPLALTDDGAFDQRHQRALTHYYAAAGAGGVAVGVHTTQFEIRDPAVGLLEPVLRCAAETLDAVEAAGGPRLVRIAGVCGPTDQAQREAALAADLGYHAGLLSLSALGEADTDELIRHCTAVAEHIPLVGFYLQRAVGGRRLDYDFWRRFAAIDNVAAVKIAPFDRYATLDVVRGVAASGRGQNVALYTGNDDNIVADLLTRYDVADEAHRPLTLRICGGLLGHWAVWTRRAVELLARCQQAVADGQADDDLLATGAAVTDMNAAVFDTAHDFAGVIAGVQHVLHGQGLLASPRCLNPNERLSPGQAEEIARARAAYPHLLDDDFVAAGRDEWLPE